MDYIYIFALGLLLGHIFTKGRKFEININRVVKSGDQNGE